MGCINLKNKTLKEGDQDNKDQTCVMSNKKKIVMGGLNGSGKTSILWRMKHNTFCQNIPTSSCMQIEQIPIKEELDFLIYDIDSKNPKMQQQHYSDADAIIFVIDSCDHQRMWRVKEELIKISSEMRYTEAVVLVLLNKQDQEETIDINTLIQETGVHSELDLDVFIQKCSAKSGEGLQEGLDKLINYFQKEDKKVF